MVREDEGKWDIFRVEKTKGTYGFQIHSQAAGEAFLCGGVGGRGGPAGQGFGGHGAAGEGEGGVGGEVEIGIWFRGGGRSQEFSEHHAPVETHGTGLVNLGWCDLGEWREGEGVAGRVDDVGEFVGAVGGGEVEEGGQVGLEDVEVGKFAGEAGEVGWWRGGGCGIGGEEAGDCGVDFGLAGAGDGEAGAVEF